MDNMLAPGMDRLLGEVDIPVGRKANGDVRTRKAGGGIHLQLLFQNILQAVHDNDGVTIAEAGKAIERSYNNLLPRMVRLYSDAPEDGVDACVRVVLSQMVLRGFLVEEQGTWRKGPEFVLDEPMRMVQRSSGEWVTAMVPKVMPTELTIDGEIDKKREDGAALVRAAALRLKPRSTKTLRGLRTPIKRHIVEAIKADVKARGLCMDRPEFKVLVDQEDRILDGRHRRVAAEELKSEHQWDPSWGEGWPVERIHVHSDEQALLIAIQRNRSHTLNLDDVDSELRKALDWLSRPSKREMVRLELRHNHERSNADIAAIVGCSDHIVAEERTALQQTSQIARFVEAGGRPKDQDMHERIRQALQHDATQRDVAIAQAVGSNRTTVGKVRREMEEAGEAPSHRGKRAPRKPKEPKPLPADDLRIITQMKEGIRQRHKQGSIFVATGFKSHSGDSRARRLYDQAKLEIAVENAEQRTAATVPATTIESVAQESEATAQEVNGSQAMPAFANDPGQELFDDVMVQIEAQLCRLSPAERDRARKLVCGQGN